MAVKKFPPPPDMGRDNQKLNRWLIEIQSILNSGGTIDPDNVDGLVAFITQTAAAIVTLNNEVATLNNEVAANTADIATLTAEVAANTADIAALTARNQILNGAGVPAVGLGNDGDLYSNTTGGALTNLYSKRGGAWVAIA